MIYWLLWTVFDASGFPSRINYFSTHQSLLFTYFSFFHAHIFSLPPFISLWCPFACTLTHERVRSEALWHRSISRLRKVRNKKTVMTLDQLSCLNVAVSIKFQVDMIDFGISFLISYINSGKVEEDLLKKDKRPLCWELDTLNTYALNNGTRHTSMFI